MYLDRKAAALAILDVAERNRSDHIWLTVSPAILNRLDSLVHQAVIRLVKQHPAASDAIKVLPPELCRGWRAPKAPKRPKRGRPRKESAA